MAELTVRQARHLLDTWRKWHEDRDGLVCNAHDAGVPKSEISRLTGLARTTVDRIIEGKR